MPDNNNEIKLIVKSTKCPQNHPCPSVRICPKGALSQKEHNAPTVDMEKCIKCGKCTKYCPKGVLVLE
jgi:Fe-S-cluster-containing hydrogenase component 2